MNNEIIIINKGDTLTHVAGLLKDKNIIKSAEFYKYLAIGIKRPKVLTGKYRILKGMSSIDIIQKISSGDVLRRKITIPEGYNIWEIAELLEENKITDSAEFLRLASDPAFLSSLGLEYQSIEGCLFPETYVFAENKPADDVMSVMFSEFRNMFDTVDLSNIRKMKLDTYELIILASLIEKEARVSKERKYISAVFHNRLRRNMTMGCDPTVRYAVKKFKGRITYRDLKFDSPYNTYLYKGLPPTPICSPGKDAILAALNPVNTSFLYFVSRNDGSHYFSKNLKEHNRAVEFYQKGIDNGFKDNQEL